MVYNDSPILNTTVPETIGGKNLLIFPMNAPMIIEINAPINCDPNTASTPYAVPTLKFAH